MSTHQNTTITATLPPQSPMPPQSLKRAREENIYSIGNSSKAVFLRSVLPPQLIEEMDKKYLRPHGRRCSWVVTIHRMEPGSDPESPNLMPHLTLGGMAASYFEAESAVSKQVRELQGTLGEVEIHYAIQNGKEVTVDLELYPSDLPSDCEEDAQARPVKKTTNEKAPATNAAKSASFCCVGTVFQLDNDFHFTGEQSMAGFEPTKEAAEKKVAKWIWDYLEPLLHDYYPDWKQEVGEQKEGETLYTYLERFKEANLRFTGDPVVDHLDFSGQFFWNTEKGKMAEVDLEW